MKLVSPKTLLASLLGIIFVIIKIRTFDGIIDLFWILLFGYLIMKGLNVAFSQDAYEEDIREADQGKALYKDLFGRFSFIATDVPIIILLLTGLLAVFCPVTPILRIVIWVCLIFVLVYAIWISWYISKHKRKRIESGEWGTAVLSAEDELSWRRYEFWHNTIGMVIIVLCALYMCFGDPRIYINNNNLKDVLTELESSKVTLEEAVPFEWTAVYSFDPYTSLDRIRHVTGSRSPALKEGVSEGMTHIVFTNKGSVVASVCAYPSSIGYSVHFSGGENTYYDYRDGGYSHIEFGDQIEFSVTKDNGIVNLYAFIE